MFKPVNRYVLINNRKPVVENETPMGILLPDDYKPTEERYTSYNVLGWADDIRFDLDNTDSIIVDNSMIEEITVDNSTYSIVQDNYIVGIIRK
jgi:co-chaperonin GroES (HSP10)|tara:strand:+ start:342 stop:620 length:279 start_codon:yes stop_codon:yes gene_type:complete